MQSFFKNFEKTPLTKEEWEEIRRYQRLSFHQKLKTLDNYRLFMFQIWKQNPELYRMHLKHRQGQT